MKDTNKKIYIFIVIFIALIHSAIFSFFPGLPSTSRDAVHYDTIALNIAEGRGFSLSSSEPFIPTMFREPGYPYFLAGVYAIFGKNPNVVKSMQIVLFLLIVLLTYFLSREIFGNRVARYATLAVAFCPTLANYTSYILSEVLFTFLILASTYCLVRFAKDGKNRWIILSGVLFALSALTKSIMLLVFIAIMVAFISAAKGIRGFIGSYLRKYFLFLAVFILVIAPWSLRNKTLFNTYNITVRQGMALYDRAEKLDYTREVLLKNLTYNFSEYFGKKFFPDTGIKGENFILQGSKKANLEFKDLITKQGYTEIEADNIMKNMALTKIRQKPVAYIIQIPLELIKQFSFLYIPLLNEPIVVLRLSSTEVGRIGLLMARAFMRILGYLVIALTVLGLYKSRGSQGIYVYPMFLILYMNILPALLFGNGRYAVPLIPLYAVFSIAAIAAEKKKVKS